MKHFLSHQYRDAVAKYKKLKARFEKNVQEKSHLWSKKKSLYQRLKKLYTRIQRLETQLKWSISAGALSIAFTAFSTQKSFGQDKFKYIERNLNIKPKVGYIASSAPTYPTFADLDGDGDKDLIIGLYRGGALFYQRNDTVGRVYTLIPNNDVRSPFRDAIADMRGYLYFNPSFADMDGDGDLDMIVGHNYNNNYYDYVTLFKSVDGQFVPFTGAANPFLSVKLGDGVGGIDGGARGEMFDADGDGDLDLFVSGTDDVLGTKYGINVEYYENYEDNTGVFQEVTGANNPLDHVSISPTYYYTGYGSLTFADADEDGDLDAYITEKYGAVYEYKNNGSNVFGPQTIHPTLTFPYVYAYAHTAAFEDLDGDGDLDVIFGDKYYNTLPYKKNNGGGVFTLVDNNVNNNTNTDFDIEQERLPAALRMSSTAIADLDADGDLDAVTFSYSGNTYLFRNLGSNEKPNFELVTTPNAFTPLNGSTFKPTIDLVDFDNDGDADLVVKDYNSLTPRYFMNNNNASFSEQILAANPFNTINIARAAKIQVIDYDNDGDFDLIAGDYNSIRVFRNDGSGFTELTGTSNPFNNINTTLANTTPLFKYITPTLSDIDNDGDLDLLFGTFNNLSDLSGLVFDRRYIYYYRNNNGVYEANVADNPFNTFAANRFPLLDFGDIDGDNDLDAIIGEFVPNTTPPPQPARIRYFERVGNNFCPKVQEIRRQINTNQVYEFTKEEFTEVYSDEPDTKNKDFPKIKILIPPAYGKLIIGGEIATFGLEIPYAGIDNMVYVPNNGYTGIDNFVWAAFDPVGMCYSNGGNFRFGVGTDVTAINDDLVGSVVVFPNPAKDRFHINLDRNLSSRVEVKLYNTLGSVIHVATYSSPEQVESVDVSKLPKGMYVLQISNEGRKGVFKLVKE